MSVRRSRRRMRLGFSLIELLIVVAIIAALVGVAVPMFSQNIQEANIAKARQDMDTIKQAITLHDSQERPLTGTSLKPLLGRYLQELPEDPWGNDYYLDANIGVVISFGADQQPGGLTDADRDIPIFFKPALKIAKASYLANWGTPAEGNLMRLTFAKPFLIETGQEAEAVKNLVLILDQRSNTLIGFNDPGDARQDPIPKDSAENPIPINETYGKKWGSAVWAYEAALSDPNAGLMVIKCTTSGGSQDLKITSSMAINIDRSVVPTGTTSGASASDGKMSNSKIREAPVAKGPLDSSEDGLFGKAAEQIVDISGAFPIDLVGEENRGVPIQRIRK